MRPSTHTVVVCSIREHWVGSGTDETGLVARAIVTASTYSTAVVRLFVFLAHVLAAPADAELGCVSTGGCVCSCTAVDRGQPRSVKENENWKCVTLLTCAARRAAWFAWRRACVLSQRDETREPVFSERCGTLSFSCSVHVSVSHLDSNDLPSASLFGCAHVYSTPHSACTTALSYIHSNH